MSKSYLGPPEVRALKDVNLSIHQGEFVAIEGPSGGGKSTLLNVIGLLDVPTSGSYLVDGVDVSRLSDVQLAQYRSDMFAFIFQSFYLLDRRQVIDSVELGLLYRGLSDEERRRRALEALSHVGLAGYGERPANLLSGGQRQRVAIARALASGAPVIVADEPTGNLDSENARIVIKALRELNKQGRTVVLVTHSPDLAATADRRIRISDGHVIGAVNAVDRWVLDTTIAQVPGAASVLKYKDLVIDAGRSLASRLRRTALLGVAVALGVGLGVATTGISSSASAQVSDAFNAEANRYVTVSWDADEPVRPVAAGMIAQRLRNIAGVQSAAVVSSFGGVELRTNQMRRTFSAEVFAVSGQIARAAQLHIKWASPRQRTLTGNDVLVGTSLARQIGVGPLIGSPTVEINGRTFVVRGLIESSSRLPEWVGKALVPDSSDIGVERTGSAALVLARPGAAQQVALQAPPAVDPYNPKSLHVDAPTDPSNLRGKVEGSLAALLYVVTGVAFLASLAGLANAMNLAVMERRQEIGLRRALGARRRHIAELMLVESSVVGLVGGVVGLLAGLLSILVVTLVQKWLPVLDLRIAPVALLGGVLVGALGGIAASARAARVPPTDALRL